MVCSYRASSEPASGISNASVRRPQAAKPLCCAPFREPLPGLEPHAVTTEPNARVRTGLMVAGLIPFGWALAYAAFANPERLQIGAVIFELYAAVILSFLGGMRWGRAIARGEAAWTLVEAVVPAVLAFTALLLIPVATILGVAATGLGFAIWMLRDVRDAAWPAGFRRQRAIVSVIVLLLHLSLAVLLAVRLPG